MKVVSVILAMLFCPLILNAQAFTKKTNEVHVDLTNPINSTIPSIEWVTPQLETSFSEVNELTLDVSMISSVPIQSITLITSIGGNTIEKEYEIEAETYSKVIKQNVRLLDGENSFEFVVTNMNGGTVSSTRSVLVGTDAIANAVDANRKDYALIFVTDKYDNWGDLVNPVYDGTTIESILKEKYGFEVEIVQDATNDEVLSKLYDYNTKQFNVQDQLFIFFAGHGYFDETLGEGYVVASNSLMDDKAKTSYIPHTVLRQRIDNIKCEHIFLTMDVCFGGTIDPLLARSRNVDVYRETSDSEYLVRKLSKRTRKYLTSGSKEYVSDGIAGKHSPFAAKFIQALKEVGAGDDRILTLTELQTYFLKLPTEPRSGSFGTDDPASDFVFVAKQ